MSVLWVLFVFCPSFGGTSREAYGREGVQPDFPRPTKMASILGDDTQGLYQIIRWVWCRSSNRFASLDSNPCSNAYQVQPHQNENLQSGNPAVIVAHAAHHFLKPVTLAFREKSLDRLLHFVPCWIQCWSKNWVVFRQVASLPRCSY